MRHVPEWLPGAGFKRLAKAVSRKTNRFESAPFKWAMSQIVSTLDSDFMKQKMVDFALGLYLVHWIIRGVLHSRPHTRQKLRIVWGERRYTQMVCFSIVRRRGRHSEYRCMNCINTEGTDGNASTFKGRLSYGNVLLSHDTPFRNPRTRERRNRQCTRRKHGNTRRPSVSALCECHDKGNFTLGPGCSSW